MPEWIIEIGKQIGNPFLLFSLAVLWLMFKFMEKLIIKKDEVIEKQAVAILENVGNMKEVVTLLNVLIYGTKKQ